ncbi:MAG: gamma-glutamyl-gamma-aminobutyrate hydrolase family protein [Gammaproteobacteria bacterium]|nr:gamma-glutamyl-gamma-aminobutyrate hydrolase family protein [Gammaproteobacteria bacterium]
MFRRPVIGIPADRRVIGLHPFHLVGEKYAHAVARAVQGLPLLIPVLPEPLEVDEVLANLDGVLFPGSPSNVEPHHYEEGPSEPGTLHDPERDATTLPLIRAAIEQGVPLLGICRGFQEINVALGGKLWQRVHEQPGLLDHREDKDAPLDQQYGPAHEVLLEDGPMIAWAGGATRIRVNSLHAQGVKTLAPSLRVEARAPDGLIEAFCLPEAKAFARAVQWHPEWRVMANEFSVALFTAFGDAARERARHRATSSRG